MKNKVYELASNPFFSASFLMVVGSNMTSVLNFAYHFIMSRMLDKGSYGELATLISLMSLVGMIPLSLGLVVTKFVSVSSGDTQISNLAVWLNKKVFMLAFAIFVSLVMLTPLISRFLNLDNYLLVVFIGSLFLFSIPSTFNRSILQGVLKFKEFVISILLENGTKLLLGIILVYLGYSVFGAIVGLLLATSLGWWISRRFTRVFFKKAMEVQTPTLKPILSYSFPVIVQSLTITSFYSMDLVLVKHFFTASEAGAYAALSLLGKIIFFGSSPVANVMFPMVSKKYSKGEEFKKVFLFSFLLTFLISAGILLIYFLFPEHAIRVLPGSKYLEVSGLLFIFGIFIMLVSFVNLFLNYYLAIGKTKAVMFSLVAAVAQIFGISLFHRALMEVILVSIVCTALLALSLFVYFAYENKLGISSDSGIQTRKNNSKGS